MALGECCGGGRGLSCGFLRCRLPPTEGPAYLRRGRTGDLAGSRKTNESSMKFLKDKFAASPVWARFIPFFLFLVLTTAQGWFGEAGRYWVYLGKTLAGVWLIWLMRPYVKEMRWAFSWEAVAVGVLVFVLWVGLDPYYPKLAEPGDPWNPNTHFGTGALLAWFFVAVRIVGSSLVVPPLEEVFYRSFLYRYIAKPGFESVPFNYFAWTPFLVTSGVFGLVHPQQWLAGILCGMAYQWLVLRKNRLGDAMTAHGITNCLLGLWVAFKPAWHFW